MIGYDHFSKQECLIIQITDLEVDRIIIDKVEQWHRDRH